MTAARPSLKDTIIAMGKDCKLSQTEVYERLQPFKDGNIEEYDREYKLPLNYALLNNNYEAVNWLLDETEHPNAKINPNNYKHYLSNICHLYIDDNVLETKDPAVLNRKKVTHHFVKKIWQYRKSTDTNAEFIKNVFSEFTKKADIVPTIGFMEAMFDVMQDYILLDRPEIIPFISNFFYYAINANRHNVAKYILSVCKDKNDQVQWLNKLIAENQVLVKRFIAMNLNYETRGNVDFAKDLLENNFVCANDETFEDGIVHNLLRLRSQNRITASQVLEITKLVVEKHIDQYKKKSFYLKSFHLKLALQCKDNKELLLFLLTNTNKQDMSLQDVAQCGWESAAQMVDFYGDNNISWECMMDRDRNPREPVSLVTLLLKEKNINKTTLKKISKKLQWANLIEVTMREVESAMEKKDEEAVNILLNNYEVSFYKDYNPSDLMRREMWKYPKLVLMLTKKNFPLDKEYHGDFPLTHILRNVVNERWELKQAHEFISRLPWTEQAIDVLIRSNNFELIQNIVSSYPKTKEFIQKNPKALVTAAEMGNEKLVALLLVNNALAVTAKGLISKSLWIPALSIAVEKGFFTIVKLLIMARINYSYWSTEHYNYAAELERMFKELIGNIDKEDSKLATDLRWRMKTFIMARGKLDFSQIKMVQQDDQAELCCSFIARGVHFSVLQKHFSEEIFQKAQQLSKDNNFLQVILESKPEQPTVQPSAPDLKEEFHSKIAEDSPSVADVKDAIQPTVQPVSPSAPESCLKEFEKSVPEQKDPKPKEGENAVTPPQDAKLPVQVESLAPAVEQKIEISAVAIQPQQALVQLAAVSPQVTLGALQEKIIAGDIAENLAVSQNQDPVQIEGQPNQLKSGASSEDKESKSITPGFTQFSCVQYPATKNPNAALLEKAKLQSHQRFFRQLFDMTQRSEVWEGNQSLKSALQEFCMLQSEKVKDQIQELNSQNKQSI